MSHPLKVMDKNVVWYHGWNISEYIIVSLQSIKSSLECTNAKYYISHAYLPSLLYLGKDVNFKVDYSLLKANLFCLWSYPYHNIRFYFHYHLSNLKRIKARSKSNDKRKSLVQPIVIQWQFLLCVTKRVMKLQNKIN